MLVVVAVILRKENGDELYHNLWNGNDNKFMLCNVILWRIICSAKHDKIFSPFLRFYFLQIHKSLFFSLFEDIILIFAKKLDSRNILRIQNIISTNFFKTNCSLRQKLNFVYLFWNRFYNSYLPIEFRNLIKPFIFIFTILQWWQINSRWPYRYFLFVYLFKKEPLYKCWSFFKFFSIGSRCD